MKVTEHVRCLLTRGKKPDELVELGFPKQVITRVRRQLKKEKASQQLKAPQGAGEAKGLPEPLIVPPEGIAAMEQRLASLESNFRELESRIEGLETASVEDTSLEEIQARLDGTPALGLKHRFKCDCGASGFVALHIQCTKCDRETWWGWFPNR